MGVRAENDDRSGRADSGRKYNWKGTYDALYEEP